ncbi:MAG: hypothetical protein IJ211_00435 [Campylobacter sp.]|nr:hypothetical protein [Campylobacter sp.]
MKKLFLLLTALFLASSLSAENSDNQIALFNMATDDLRGIDVDDTKCRDAILNFYSVVAKKGEQNAEVVKEYKECMAKKQTSEEITEAKK